MRKVILNDRTGGYVGTAAIPPVEPRPEVLSWRGRVFVRAHLPPAVAAALPDGPIYTEGMIWHLPPESVDEGPVT